MNWQRLQGWTAAIEFPTNVPFLLAYPYTQATNTTPWKAFTLTHWWTVTNAYGNAVLRTNSLEVEMPAGKSWLLGMAHVTNEVVQLGQMQVRPKVLAVVTNLPPYWDPKDPGCFTVTNVSADYELVQEGTNAPINRLVLHTNVINVCLPDTLPTNTPPYIVPPNAPEQQQQQQMMSMAFTAEASSSSSFTGGGSGSIQLLGEPGSFWVLDYTPALGSGWTTLTNCYTALDEDGWGTLEFSITNEPPAATGFFRVVKPE